ncbi:MAG: TonB-dependent receptor [Bacteroidales bacterium]|nr:TonB-dependent receptor [Bacteroidales bacterium]
MSNRRFSRPLFAVLFLLFTALAAVAQDNSVKGFVYEEATGEPMMFTNVYLKGTTFGGSTDENGYFNINRIPDGHYTLLITSVGYDTISESFSLSKGQTISRKYFLKETSQQLETVTITADKIEARTETKTSVITVTPKTITKIPSVGGQADFAQYLQVVPGVIFTGDQGGQLYIRGGSPIQNKVLLDGMVVYNPFHSIGLFSVFDTDIIRNADVYTGGFGAEYSGRISSIMDISTRDGNKKRISGKIGANTFGAKVMLEGPLKKAKNPDDASMSFILSAKNSYLEQSSKYIYSYASESGLPFNFQDVYGKVSLNAPNGSKFNLFGFSFNDQVNNYMSLSDFGWNSFGAGTNFLLIPGKSPVMIEGNIAYSSYTSRMKDTDNPERFSNINGFNAGFDFTQFMGKSTLKYGIEMLGYTTNYVTYSVYGHQRIGGEPENSTELGAYVKYKATLGKFLIEPSFRFQYYPSVTLGGLSPEPRMAIKYNAAEWLRLKAAAGMYSQNFVAATSDRDVVNLFYGFLSGIDNMPKTFNGEEITSYLQKANHYILGAEFEMSKNVTLNVEGYWKDFVQLTNINRNKIYAETEQNANIPDLLKKDFTKETGDAYGCDISLKFENQHWYLWAVYALGFVTREYEKAVDNGVELVQYAPHFDRRHNINLILTYTAGSKRQWEFSGRWNFGSGFPFTQVQGFYEYYSFQDGINFDYTNTNGELGVLYGELNEGRLPTYHRFDIDVKRKFYFTENIMLEADFSVTNVYNRNNVFYVNLITSDVARQLPILPTFGLTFSF